MTVRITRRPTLVDGAVQAGRWWWRHWERFMEAGGGGGRGTTAFTAEGAEDAEDVAREQGVRFRHLTGRSLLNSGYSVSGIARGEDYRRVTPASLILSNSSGGAGPDDPTGAMADHPPRSVQRVEAPRKDCPETLPPRRRSIAAKPSAFSAPSAVKRSSTPAPDPEAAPCP